MRSIEDLQHRGWVIPMTVSGVLIVLGAMSFVFGPSSRGQDEPVAEFRSYADGPLTDRDYHASVPQDTGGLDAFTTTELRFNFQYRAYRSGRRVRAWTTKIDVYAVVIPSKSWNRRLRDKRLLDHEQGHFDLTHISALQAQRHFAASGRLVGVASAEEQAVADLTRQLEQEMQEFKQELLAEHHKYDELTRHGRARAEQDEHRRRHRELLQKLSEQTDDPVPEDRNR